MKIIKEMEGDTPEMCVCVYTV